VSNFATGQPISVAADLSNDSLPAGTDGMTPTLSTATGSEAGLAPQTASVPDGLDNALAPSAAPNLAIVHPIEDPTGGSPVAVSNFAAGQPISVTADLSNDTLGNADGALVSGGGLDIKVADTTAKAPADELFANGMHTDYALALARTPSPDQTGPVVEQTSASAVPADVAVAPDPEAVSQPNQTATDQITNPTAPTVSDLTHTLDPIAMQSHTSVL
jgi:hypothetical protein